MDAKTVIILGELIDVRKIYAISAIIEPNKWRFNDSEGSTDKSQHWRYRFTISFINNKPMTIDEYHAGSKETLERIRTKLIEFWAENPHNIPELK